MTILRIFLVILLICIIKYTKLVRFIRLICRIVDFSSLLIIEVIAKNVKNAIFGKWPNLLPHPLLLILTQSCTIKNYDPVCTTSKNGFLSTTHSSTAINRSALVHVI